jgi:hypothetical protein
MQSYEYLFHKSLLDNILEKKEVRYLGHVISQDGIKTDPDKTKAIKNWKVPTNEKELRLYLGLCSYYRKFVPEFSKIAAPLIGKP